MHVYSSASAHSFRKKNKWLNQQIRWKFQNKKEIGKYRKRQNKTENNVPRITETVYGTDGATNAYLDGWSVYNPPAPYPTIDYWLHPMSDRNLSHLHADLKLDQQIKEQFQFQSNNNQRNAQLEESEKLMLLLSGYLREIYEHHGIETGSDIQETIRKYAWNIPPHSMHCIAATHLLASIIHRHISNENNKCEYSNNKDFNILEYIYIRGGALRDCYLLRRIRDIDIVVNIYDLSMAYLNHLNKYHSKHASATDSTCIYWRHYTNKLKPYTQKKRNKYPSYGGADHRVNKIIKFEYHIMSCNYMLNAKFIANILKKHDSDLFYTASRYHGLHWIVDLNYCVHYDGLELSDVQFDIVDGSGNADARYKTYSKYGILRGLDTTIEDTVFYIDAYHSSYNRPINSSGYITISVPLYPFPWDCAYYDFTINAIHIDLFNVLLNYNNNSRNTVDYNWECKIHKKYENETIYKYNLMARNDMNQKILRCPSLCVINEVSAHYYFWRFVKMLQKFIYKIETHVWKVHSKFLQHTIKHYEKWLNDTFIEDGSVLQFIHKLLTWNIEDEHDYIERFKVFQFITFDKHFMKQLRKYPVKFRGLLKNEINRKLSNEHRNMLRFCFEQFGYPSIGIENDWTNTVNHAINYGVEYES